MTRPMTTAAATILLLALAAVVPPLIRAPSPAAAAEWTDTVTGMRFRRIDAGTFTMGTPDSETLREPQEVLHAVTISRAFYLGEAEVTQREWTRVMGSNPSHFQDCGPGCPVEGVSWSDVQAFIDRLNRLSTPGFRLPTEAEWEYACRAGGSAAFGARGTLSSRDANINGNYPYQAPVGVFRRRPTPVRRFPANRWHLYDMSGNVWEWVQDEHCPYATGPVTDPVGACGSDRRVIRGGSWAFDGGSARCGTRYTHRPQDTGYSLGFRVARESAIQNP